MRKVFSSVLNIVNVRMLKCWCSSCWVLRFSVLVKSRMFRILLSMKLVKFRVLSSLVV